MKLGYLSEISQEARIQKECVVMKHQRKPIHSYCVLLLMLLGFVAVQESQAALITYNFEGSVGGVSGSTNPFTIGQTVSGSFTYDTSTAPSFLDPVNANYSGAVTNLSLTLGSYVIAGTTGDSGVYNNNDVFGDGFWIRSPTTGVPISGMSPTDFDLLLQDFSGAALDSTALGPLPPASAFGIKTFGLQFANNSYPGQIHVTGDITSVTPIPLPGTAVLFPTGLTLIATAFRRLRE